MPLQQEAVHILPYAQEPPCASFSSHTLHIKMTNKWPLSKYKWSNIDNSSNCLSFKVQQITAFISFKIQAIIFLVANGFVRPNGLPTPSDLPILIFSIFTRDGCQKFLLTSSSSTKNGQLCDDAAQQSGNKDLGSKPEVSYDFLRSCNDQT